MKKSRIEVASRNIKYIAQNVKMTIEKAVKRLILGSEKRPEDTADYHYEYNTDTRTREDEWNDFIKYEKYPFIIYCFYGVLVLHILTGGLTYVYSIVNLNSKFLSKNPLLICFWCLAPIGVWIWSTMFTYWNYWNRKIGSLKLIVIEIIVIICQQLVRFSYHPVVLGLSKIPINSSLSTGMIVNLGRFILIFISLLPSIVMAYKIFDIMYEKDNKESILYFKIGRGRDFRKDKAYKYDFKAVYEMDTGKQYIVKEKDRTLHTFADGTTGTAKTSSVLTPAIADDLDQKVFNEDCQKRECIKEIKKGNFKIVRPFTNEDFSINYIEPVLLEGQQHALTNRLRQRRYDYLKYMIQSAGITVVAPNDAFADEVYELTSNRKLKVNRVDPILTEEGEQKPGFIGFNPFYISPLIKGVARDIDITNKANIFADILQALYEMSGAGDAYFISLNNSVTIATCKLLMLTYPYLNEGRQPDPGDVQRCINDFALMKPYLNMLVDKYGRRQTQDHYDRVSAEAATVDCGIWQDVYTLIHNDLMGPNQEAMTDRANGLRLQINNFINHPLVRRVFCAENTLDIDKALANGEIIIVNYALELGKSVSMAFGLFFLLSYSKACLRRPGTESTRILNFNYIDELPVLLHPELEEFFTLFRQYKVANIVALQTLDQMDKSQMTKYLKGILLGNCAHQIVFGRVSPTEMETYEKMGGKKADVLKQDTISQTSLTQENPSYSYSTRETRQLSNRMEGSDFRYRDFQEVTFFTVDDGSPVPPFVGRVNFLPSAKRKGKARLAIDWHLFYPPELLAERKRKAVPHRQFEYSTSGQVCSNIGAEKSIVRFTAQGIIREEIIEEMNIAGFTAGNPNQKNLHMTKYEKPEPVINKTGGVSVSNVTIETEEDSADNDEFKLDDEQKDFHNEGDCITIEELLEMANKMS